MAPTITSFTSSSRTRFRRPSSHHTSSESTTTTVTPANGLVTTAATTITTSTTTPGATPIIGSTATANTSLDEPEVAHAHFFLDNRLPMEYFKQDILNLAHALRISRWKRVDASMATDIVVSRISGALTNAIYSVDPPPYLKDMIKQTHNTENPLSANTRTYHHKVPQRLLLRVYGPQVAHIIDREKELSTVARLSARNIGPRLLGTFDNGRFEQFLHAKPLTKELIRVPEVSIQIAKRMRELHDNINLLEEERAKGPGVWLNIDKWMKRALDKLKELERKRPGAVVNLLQADWPTFWKYLSKYREWITEKYGKDRIIQELVFSHNDVSSDDQFSSLELRKWIVTLIYT